MNYVYKKELAKKLRNDGYSYSYISKQIGVSKATLSSWLSGISYVPNKETINLIGKARAAAAISKSKKKTQSIKKAKEEAKAEIHPLKKRDLFMLGVGLYWGEGTKTHNVIRVVNSDPRVINLSIKWFMEICGLDRPNFVIRLHLYPDSSVEESTNFWSEVTRIPKEQFQKPQIDYRKKEVSKKGKSPHGTAHLTVKSLGDKRFGVFLGRKINAWIDEVANW